ncbi:MAG: hypothetical protein LBB88_11030 [Planctomycetaceae bacterium]|jgi:hypothetical protein|nr:hypothetical protein [Planctomycetaceae bacterium]
MMTKKIKFTFIVTFIFIISILCSVGLQNIVTKNLVPPNRFYSSKENSSSQNNEHNSHDTITVDNFISGQLTASLGELCVFKLNDSSIIADWQVVPPASCYVDSSGSSLVFATNIPASYTIIAAIVIEGKPKILTHVCNYGITPEPTPKPNPEPTPNPPSSLSEWVRQNIPNAEIKQVENLAACYKSTIDAIDKGAVKTIPAALNLLRTSTQTKIDITIWRDFLDKLSEKISPQLNNCNDIQKLKNILSEIYSGLQIHSNQSKIMKSINVTKNTRRQVEPILEDGCIINGCIPQDDYAEEVFSELDANSIEFNTLWEVGEMPILKFDDAFREWRKRQIDEREKIMSERITCLLTWQILKHLPTDLKKSERLYFSQGNLGSCMGHADSFAHHSATLQMIARGAPLIYVTFNPIVTWSITKGGSIRGGQSVAEMAQGANSIGHFPEYLVGTNNQSVPEFQSQIEVAKNFQSAIMFLKFQGVELADEIIQCCAAGLSVALGNSTAVSGSNIDKNGIKVATLRGSWAHATHFTMYRVVNGTEYIGWVNSHGFRYNNSDEGEPADMCWMSRDLVEKFVATASGYGSPYVVFPESVTKTDTSLYVNRSIPFPENWRT